MPSFVWTALWYAGMCVGTYFIVAVGFLLFARLEKDKDGSLIIDPKSLHYRACQKCYGCEWTRTYNIYNLEAKEYVPTTYVEHCQLGLCGYFWRVFWAFILLPIGYTILFAFQTVKAIVYAPFMLLFGFYPWPTVEIIKREGHPLVVEVKRISFPRVGKLELKPYLVILPALYGYVYWLYPDRTLSWSVMALVIGVILAAVFAVRIAFDKVQESENEPVVLVREYVKLAWRGVCLRLKVKSEPQS